MSQIEEFPTAISQNANVDENAKVERSVETFTVVMEFVKVSKRTLVIFLWFSESPPLESFCFVE